MAAEVDITLSKIQQSAMSDFTDTNSVELLYFGSARSGKTWLVILNIILRALRYPNSRHLISRYRANHLEVSVWRQTLIPFLRDVFPDLPYNIDKVYRTITFANGSEIVGLALEDPDRIAKIMGTEFATVFINEATQITYPVYQALKTRCVQSVAGCKNKIVLDCNPTNQFHWIYRYFIQGVDPDDIEKPIKSSTRVRGPWLPEHNYTLSNDALEMFNTLSGVQYQRLALGQWVSSEGLVFPDYMGAVIDPFPVSWDCEFYAAVDFGYSNPFVWLWIAKHYATETYYIFDEYYKTERTISEHIDHLNDYTPENMQKPMLAGLIDYKAIIADHDPGDAEELRRGGYNTIKAEKDIVSGINSMRDLMNSKRGWKLRIFSSCRNLLTELSSYRYSDKKHGDDRDEKPIKEADHCFAADTLILTNRGPVKICEVVTSDKVLTPYGWSAVLIVDKTGVKNTIDYGVFRCTPNHRIPTTSGMMEIGEMDGSESVLTWGQPRGWSLMEFLIGVIQSHPIEILRYTFGGLLLKNLATKRDFYTAMYGNGIMAKSLMICWSITSTAIPAIMTLPILSWYLAKSIASVIHKTMSGAKSILIKSGLLQRNGMLRPKGESGIESMPKRSLLKSRIGWLRKIAKYAGRNTKRPCLHTANTVISIAGSRQSGIERKEEVWNMQTENGFYFANGVLVGNCIDAARYFCRHVSKPAAAVILGRLA